MESEKTEAEQEALALREAKKSERRAAMAEFKRLHAGDPEKAREAARLWFEEHAEPADASVPEKDPFHLRKLSEADPGRSAKAAESVRKSEADAERAQKASRDAVKEWRDRNPNKVKKLNKAKTQAYGARQKSK